MFKFSRPFIAAFCAFALVSSAAMADVTLKIGDPAPAISVAKFVKGEPVAKFEKGKLYVVEFWATWCPPCRESIPHLTEMQKTYPDVTFIGCDVGEDEAKVQPFVNDMGEKMNYRVAIDDLTKEGGAMNSSYMDASGQDGIPTAFVVDKDSNIAWIGHPMELEPVLKQVVAGTFDEKKAAAASADKAKIMGLLKNQDFDGAMKAIDDVVAADPTQAGELGALQVQILLAGKKDPMAAAKKAEEIAPKIEDAEQLNEIAWALATAEKTTPETLAAAKKLSESSLEKKKDEPGYLDTLARIYAAGGDFAKATELETKAADKNTDEKMKPTLDKALEAYKAGTLPAAE